MPQCKISHWGGTEQTGWAAKPGAEEDKTASVQSWWCLPVV